MTLDTTVAIGGGAVNAREVFDLARAMVNTPADVEPAADPVKFGPDHGVKRLANPGGIGADAWLITYYGADGPIPAHACSESCYLDDIEDLVADGLPATSERCMDARSREEGNPEHSGWASMVLSFDTAYGHKGPNGEGCADLHRKYIEVLHVYAQRKGLQLKWQNEFTGEWFDGLDGLDAFGRANDDAQAWFHGTVVPAIARMATS